MTMNSRSRDLLVTLLTAFVVSVMLCCASACRAQQPAEPAATAAVPDEPQEPIMLRTFSEIRRRRAPTVN